MNKILIVLLIGYVASFTYAESGEYDWIGDHIVVRTEEKATVNDHGRVTQVVTTKRSKVTVSQTMTETLKLNDKGELVLVNRKRTTEAINTDGHKTNISEVETPTDAGLAVQSISTTTKTSNGTISTVQNRNKDGSLVIVRRTTVARDEEGVLTITVETPDKEGKLVVREVITKH
ncbi:hypothetical protein BVX97_00110 [bacterium E08(2017)]|nr:hypothetical protein BVX97_00110 [bacterium E08(2017)]